MSGPLMEAYLLAGHGVAKFLVPRLVPLRCADRFALTGPHSAHSGPYKLLQATSGTFSLDSPGKVFSILHFVPNY